MGDFNLPDINWTSWSSNAQNDVTNCAFLDAFAALHLCQLISFPTRHNATLDLILAPKLPSPVVISNVTDAGPMANSDHSAIVFDVTTPLPISSRTHAAPPPKYCFARCNFAEAETRLCAIDWSTLLPLDLPVDTLLERFMSVCRDVIKATVPVVSPSSFRCRPLPKHIRRVQLAKWRAWALYSNSRSMHHRRRLHALTVRLRALIRFHRAAQEDKLVSCGNSNLFFKCMKHITSPSQVSPVLNVNGSILDSPAEVTATFNATFAQNFNLNSPVPPPAYVIFPGAPSLSDLTFSEGDVREALLHLKPSTSSPDNLPGIFLSRLAFQLSSPIHRISTSSLSSAVFPCRWKQATVIPIFKGKGSVTDPITYRPISLTPVLSKVLERLVANKLTSRITNNKLDDCKQHGFVAGRSAVSNLIVADSLLSTHIDSHTPVDMIFFDFSKAFDRVPHNLLIHRLAQLGIHGSLLNWLASFLTSRTQSVHVSDLYSPPTSVASGVIQGSVLGPTLFSSFISSIASCILYSYHLFYADDLKIIHTITSPASHAELQSDLDRLPAWSITWGMSFNKAKCQVLHLGLHNPRHQYWLGGDLLQPADSLDDLGLLRTAKTPCDYDAHAQRCLRRAYGAISIILRGLSSRRPTIMRRVFTTYIRPIVEFAAALWFPSSVGGRDRLERLQRSFTKRIAGFNTISYDVRLRLLNLPKLSTRVNLIKLITMYKIVHGQIGISLRDINLAINSGVTRANGIRLTLPAPRTNTMLHSFAYSAGQLWNSLPRHIVEAPTVSLFKLHLSRINIDDL